METNITMQQLKEQRLTPAEKFVLDKIKGVNPSEPDKDGYIKWYKDDKLLFELDFYSGYLWVSYNHIRSILQNEYGLNNNEIRQLINNVMCKYTNNGQLTPIFV